ncbi:hypothetical protein [uncultured Enterovirga sp.]|uniref:hypothetical protein n=1 Tax=uncultured Enterovirga sp. TaxID=2026352 RepID=UPI0035CBFEBE
MTLGSARRAGAALVLAGALSPAVVAGSEREAPSLAEALYLGLPGESRVAALVGAASASVPASGFGCRNCHGRDGRGGREGALSAPSIERAVLDRASARRPAYTEAAFGELLRTGRDPGGRLLDSSMPRYVLDPAAVHALWSYLDIRAGIERRRVSADAVVLAFDGRAGADLPAAMARALGADGLILHGRRLRFVSIDEPERLDAIEAFALLFATVRVTEFRDRNIPLLFPLTPLQSRPRPDEVRGMFASRSDQADALLKAAPATARVVVDRSGRSMISDLIASEGRSLVDPSSLTELDGDVIVIGDRETWDQVARLAGPGSRIFGLGSEMAGAFERLASSGAHLVLTDATMASDASAESPARDRFARTAAALIVEAVSLAGRDLTRGGLMRAFDRIRLSRRDWPPIDYARHPATGTRESVIRHIPSRPAPDRRDGRTMSRNEP